MIVSRQNRRLKDIRALRPSKGERALLEGSHLVAEALSAGVAIEYALATPGYLAGSEGTSLATRLDAPPLATEPTLLDELADADSPRGIVAVARLPRGGVEALPDGARTVVWAERLQDPGNLGALARVVEASGADALALSPGCCHPNHPRALRASAGSLLRLPVAVGAALPSLRARYPEARTVALVPRGGVELWSALLEGPLLLLLGSEGQGLAPEIAASAHLRLTVPTASAVESLNATVAAAVTLYEVRRRRGA